jgi:hypothetical protein
VQAEGNRVAIRTLGLWRGAQRESSSWVLTDNGWLGGKSCAYRGLHRRLREADMDRTVFESVEREIDDEVLRGSPAT